MPPSLILNLIAAAYLASLITLAVALYLFASLKIEMRKTARREAQRLDDMASRIASSLEPAETVYVPVEPRPGLHLERRAHALRLLRRGEEAAHIAAVLAIPRREVELLVRVQEMVSAGRRGDAEAAIRPA
jgi:hypothetical protein